MIWRIITDEYCIIKDGNVYRKQLGMKILFKFVILSETDKETLMTYLSVVFPFFLCVTFAWFLYKIAKALLQRFRFVLMVYAKLECPVITLNYHVLFFCISTLVHNKILFWERRYLLF